jgi:tagaturonate epimerase
MQPKADSFDREIDSIRLQAAPILTHMNSMLTISKYTLGVGDRFAQQASAQLRACIMAAEEGCQVSPSWNKSNREHNIIGSEPASVRAAAEAAIKAARWSQPYYVDADHIGLKTVDRFLDASDFFTIDVADSIGKPAPSDAVAAFVAHHGELADKVQVRGIERPFVISRAEVERIAGKYLGAVQEAAKVYEHISQGNAGKPFVTEVSMDETDVPQTPVEMLVILAALSDARIPVQTIAPKFTGRFNKGVDYVGNAAQFEREFNEDVCVVAHAVARYGLPKSLKLSVHSGSDKFSIYPAIGRALARHGCGVHIKTAGTTWLEEVVGLAEHGGGGLATAKEIYSEALAHIDELCAPYATVIDIDRSKLPATTAVIVWTSEQFVRALRHNPADPLFNPNLRQLIHVGFKVAARMGQRYLDQLGECKASVARNVTTNLFDRHIKPIFMQTCQGVS